MQYKKTILVVGASGFIGSNIADRLPDDYRVVRAARSYKNIEDLKYKYIDLDQPETIRAVLEEVKPAVIINAAGNISRSVDVDANARSTKVLLDVCSRSADFVELVLVLGSAAEYGQISDSVEAVDEDLPRNPTSQYGVSKKNEIDQAISYEAPTTMRIAVLRLFNVIGSGMNTQQLLPNIAHQLKDLADGRKSLVAVSRKDAMRDFIDIVDVCSVINLIIKSYNKMSYNVYNLGSGKSTSVEQLVKLIAKEFGIKDNVIIKNTSNTPESKVASCSNNSRLEKDFGKIELTPLAETIGRIVRS